jgi:hypothetical protein
MVFLNEHFYSSWERGWHQSDVLSMCFDIAAISVEDDEGWKARKTITPVSAFLSPSSWKSVQDSHIPSEERRRR